MGHKDEEKAMLEWCLKLTYSGMTLDMVRYWMLKKHQELLASRSNVDLDLPIKVGAEKEDHES